MRNKRSAVRVVNVILHQINIHRFIGMSCFGVMLLMSDVFNFAMELKTLIIKKMKQPWRMFVDLHFSFNPWYNYLALFSTAIFFIRYVKEFIYIYYIQWFMIITLVHVVKYVSDLWDIWNTNKHLFINTFPAMVLLIKRLNFKRILNHWNKQINSNGTSQSFREWSAIHLHTILPWHTAIRTTWEQSQPETRYLCL